VRSMCLNDECSRYVGRGNAVGTEGGADTPPGALDEPLVGRPLPVPVLPPPGAALGLWVRAGKGKDDVEGMQGLPVREGSARMTLGSKVIRDGRAGVLFGMADEALRDRAVAVVRG
jgi:hypothetical protein